MLRKPSIIGLFSFFTFIFLCFSSYFIILILSNGNVVIPYIISLINAVISPCIIGNIYNLKYKELIDNRIKLKSSIYYTVFISIFILLIILYINSWSFKHLFSFSIERYFLFFLFIIFSVLISYYIFNYALNLNHLSVLMIVTTGFLLTLIYIISNYSKNDIWNLLILVLPFPFSSILSTAVFTKYNKKIISVSLILLILLIYVSFFFFPLFSIITEKKDSLELIILFIFYWFVVCFPAIRCTNLICYINQNLGKLYEYRFKSKIKNSIIILLFSSLFLAYLSFTNNLFSHILSVINLFTIYALPLYLFPVLLKLFYREIKISEPLEFPGDENPAAEQL